MNIKLALEWFINPDHLPFMVGLDDEFGCVELKPKSKGCCLTLVIPLSFICIDWELPTALAEALITVLVKLENEIVSTNTLVWWSLPVASGTSFVKPKSAKFVRAKFDYTTEEEDELSFKEGDLLYILGGVPINIEIQIRQLYILVN